MKSYLRFTNIFISFLFLLTTASCATFQIGIVQTPQPNLGLTGTVQALKTANAGLAAILSIPLPTNTPTPPPSEQTNEPSGPTITPTPSGPRFSSLRFATSPNAPVTRRFYVAGTPRIYAIWDYANMQDGMVVRREWLRDGQSWIVREDPWDMQKYGTSGTVRDIAIFDDNIGLQAGEYTLILSIDGIVQNVGDNIFIQEKGVFWIFAPEVREQVVSPNGNRIAYVRNGGRLIVEYDDGRVREMAIADEISSISWFPNNRHLIYAERDRTDQVSPTEDWGIAHKLWILDVETGERLLTSTSGENFHHPVISPNGRYIAALAGSTFNDRCFSSPSLVVVEFNEEMRRSSVYTVEDFEGIPFLGGDSSGAYPSAHNNPGTWEADDKLLASLWWLCLTTNGTPNGTYLLDISDLRAEKVGGL